MIWVELLPESRAALTKELLFSARVWLRATREYLGQLITASARNCPVQVVGSERVRWSYYEGGKLYLLNTDYDMPITVKVIADGMEQTVTLKSLELKALQI